MAVTASGGRERSDRYWSWFRKAMWGGATFLVLLPAVAMRFTDDVNWTESDFVFAAALLFGSAGIIEVAARANASLAYRAGVVAAVGATFLTIWANGAVGMIGILSLTATVLITRSVRLRLDEPTKR